MQERQASHYLQVGSQGQPYKLCERQTPSDQHMKATTKPTHNQRNYSVLHEDTPEERRHQTLLAIPEIFTEYLPALKY